MKKRRVPHSPIDFVLEPQAMRDGDWASRDGNPVAACIASQLPSGTVLYVDVAQDEYYLRRGEFSQWYGLPDDLADRVAWARAALERGDEVADIPFTLWLPDCIFP